MRALWLAVMLTGCATVPVAPEPTKEEVEETDEEYEARMARQRARNRRLAADIERIGRIWSGGKPIIEVEEEDDE